MLKQVIAKGKCYIILYCGAYCSDRIVGVFQKKEEAECFVHTMNSQLAPEERQQWWFSMCETGIITEWELENF